MSALDIAICVILAYFLIRGIFRGLIKEVVGILGLFVAFWAANVYWKAGADQLTPIIDSATYRGVLSFVVIYLIVYFLIGLMSVFVDKIVKITITPVSSGLAGAGLGLFKGAALCVIVLAASTAFLKPTHTFYTDSWAWPKAKPLCEKVKEWMPETLRGLINSSPILSGLLDPPPRTSQPARTAQKPPATATPSAPTGRGTPRSAPIDFQSLVKMVNDNPTLVNPAWIERIKTLTPEMFNADLVNAFIRENPNLFSTFDPGPAQQGTAPAQSQPSWPTPARE
ncbi:MAG: CvpA family protein [Deltaproteobacteria bacterium]|jgi:membrane protein required for colicin V production|nr:CvpA family protein [Deltaproteobacteria bacterium]